MEFDKYPTNLVKMQLRDVDEYLFAINQIEFASTGFFRALGSNLFFNEACQCLKNSINLLKEGPEYNGSMELTYKFTLNVSDDFGDIASKEAKTYLNSGDNVEKDITISALPNDVTLYNTLNGVSIEITEVGELRYFDKIRAEFEANPLMTSNATLYIGESSI